MAEVGLRAAGPHPGRLALRQLEPDLENDGGLQIRRVESVLSDGVRFSFWHFRLTDIHPQALAASAAADAAALQGRFWQMHELLFQSLREASTVWTGRGVGVEILL